MKFQGEDAETLRQRIFRRDQYRCVYCGEVLPTDALTLDHVQPRMRGGDRSDGNLVAACKACNADKAGAPAWAYLADRVEQRENFLKYATGIWPRHRRAILQAIEKKSNTPGEPRD